MHPRRWRHEQHHFARNCNTLETVDSKAVSELSKKVVSFSINSAQTCVFFSCPDGFVCCRSLFFFYWSCESIKDPNRFFNKKKTHEVSIMCAGVCSSEPKTCLRETIQLRKHVYFAISDRPDVIKANFEGTHTHVHTHKHCSSSEVKRWLNRVWTIFLCMCVVLVRTFYSIMQSLK